MRWLGLILILVIAFILVTKSEEEGSFLAALNPFDNATTTPEADEESLSDRLFGSSSKAPAPASSLSSREVEEKATQKLEDLEELEDDERDNELFQPPSPYKGMVTLSVGGAKKTDIEKEYVILTAAKTNTEPVTITDWVLESYITERSAEIPEGARFLKTETSRSTAFIKLLSGERAYVITERSPLFVSFRENMCTGYLAEKRDFIPALDKSCPLPTDELLSFPDIQDVDECFEFVEDIRKCELANEDKLDDARLSQSCDTFVEEVLEYDGCVENHEDDLAFYDRGSWRIYLREKWELWRSKDEIIRLLDDEGRVVDVLEY